MSTFMLKNKSFQYTPVSNVFIEKYMPKARGEFVKVYLLMLKHSLSNEYGVNSSIIASSLQLLESDIINALNYWNDEGLIKLTPIDKLGNFSIEFIDISDDTKSQPKEVNLLNELSDNNNKDMLDEIQSVLGRLLSPKEMSIYLSWKDDFNFSTEVIMFLIEYCASKGKTDSRYIEKVALAWNDLNIKTIEQAQNYVKQNENKWIKIRHILNYLGIKNTEIMKPQEEMLDKWINTFGFSTEIIEKACQICFSRLNRADFKYIDGILSSWNKNNLKTIEAINEDEAKYQTNKNRNQTFNKSNVIPEKSKITFNNFEARNSDYDALEKKLLGWDNDD